MWPLPYLKALDFCCKEDDPFDIEFSPGEGELWKIQCRSQSEGLRPAFTEHLRRRVDILGKLERLRISHCLRTGEDISDERILVHCGCTPGETHPLPAGNLKTVDGT